MTIKQTIQAVKDTYNGACEADLKAAGEKRVVANAHYDALIADAEKNAVDFPASVTATANVPTPA